ncbi:MAG: TolC family protein, partial [Prolixibacteraceae bacterium]|nr:TolC family protein [Prolixibacteraceae bacterium]
LSDYLEIKSELATEKSTKAEDQGILATARVTLMQLMEFPVSDDFEIESPDIENIISSYYTVIASPNQIYKEALIVKPQIKLAALNVESAKINEKITQADLFPTLSLNAGLSTGWSDQISNFSYSEQLKNQYTPSIGLNLSIPIFGNKQGKNDIKLAQLSTEEYKLEEINTKNVLRKNIEQSCVDLNTSKAKYETSREAYNSAKESYDVAVEKFDQGIINSVDFITIKTNLTEAENNLLKQKFSLIFSNKKLEFYRGKSIYSLK